MWEGTMDWGGCLSDLNVPDPEGSCGVMGAACIMTETMPEVVYTACAIPCVDVCDCPGPPVSGTASVMCGDIDSAPGEECYLDCSGGEECPDDMDCVNGVYCAALAEPAPMYGDCIAGCAFPGLCATVEDGHRVCVSPCFDVASCEEGPGVMGASPACNGAVNPPLGEECYLDCFMASCPIGMDCVAPNAIFPALGTYQNICMWPEVP